MENYLEIDLREIVIKILKKWYWIIITGFVFGLGTFFISYLQPDVYKVTTQFILTEPLYNINFENQYQTAELERPSEEVFRVIVLSDEIVAELFDIWEADSKTGTTLQAFKLGHLSASISDAGMLVSLNVETESRIQSAAIANAWVDLAIDAVNNIYYGFETDQIGTFRGQMTEAQAEVEAAGQRLIAFSENDLSKVLASELEDLLETQKENNQIIRTIHAAQDDAEALVQVLEQEPSTNSVDPDYRMSFFLIETKVLNISNSEFTSVEFLIDYGSQVSEKTVGEFLAEIQVWSTAMSDRVSALEETNDILTDDIVDLQSQIKELENEMQMLTLDYQRQQSIYNILATKYDEVSLTIPEGTSGYVNLISKASVPEVEDRLPHNTVRNTLVAAVAGGIIGLVMILICDWWKCGEKPDPETALEE